MVTSETQYVVTATGLTPGQQVQCSLAYTPADGSPGQNTGSTTVKVSPAGIARYPFDHDEIVGQNLDGSWHSTPGHAHAWFHAQGPFDSPPLETPDGEASVDFDVT